MEVKEIIAKIKPIDSSLYAKAQERLDNLTKPKGSLGLLEELAKRYIAITGNLRPTLKKKRIYVLAGDHGVVEEGVSLYPKEVTWQMVFNFLKGGAGINVLARHVGAEVKVVDMGVDYEFGEVSSLIKAKVGYGTKNITKGPAMSVEDAIKAIKVGIDLAKQAKEDGVNILGIGDMGIGNTTPSSALMAVLLNVPVAEVTGRGTGLDDKRLQDKIRVIEKAIIVNKDRLTDPISTLAALGGYELAGLCGLVLGAAYHQIPVVIDGFITSAGALVAIKLCPHTLDYCFFSHLSQEKGHRMFYNKLGIHPVLNLDMRLGEGTGAALAMNLIEAGIKIYNEMATFDEAKVAETEDK